MGCKEIGIRIFKTNLPIKLGNSSILFSIPGRREQNIKYLSSEKYQIHECGMWRGYSIIYPCILSLLKTKISSSAILQVNLF